MNINQYLDDWAKYFIDCELRCKGRAKLNNDAKRKLRQFHLEQYLRRVESPHGFLFHLKYRHKNIGKHIACINQLYRVALEQRNKYFEEKRYEHRERNATSP